MQRPPERKTPPVLFARGGSDWIRRVHQKHKQLVELRLSAGQKERLDRWAEIEFVYSTLRLEGADIQRAEVARVVSQGWDASVVSADEPDARVIAASFRAAASAARAKGKAVELTPNLLLTFHSDPEIGFRRSCGDPSARKPVSPEHLPALIDSACRWYTAESFSELNPIEQASIVLLRLIDLQPFEQANERTALVAASLFTLRGELPPIIIKPEMHDAYRSSLDEGVRMNTQPMVDLLAQAVERSVSEMIEQAGSQE